MNQNMVKMKNKTAVEWLISEIQRYNDSGYEFHPKYNEEILEQAKEMEKDQIMDAYYEGKGNGMDISHPLSSTKEISAEQYYDETFKSE